MAQYTTEGLNAILANAFAENQHGHQVLLFDDGVTANVSSVYADFSANETTGTGYARVSLTGASFSISGGQATYPTIIFTGGAGGWGTVQGYCVVTTEDTPRSVFFDTFTSSKTIYEGDTITVDLSQSVA